MTLAVNQAGHHLLALYLYLHVSASGKVPGHEFVYLFTLYKIPKIPKIQSLFENLNIIRILFNPRDKGLLNLIAMATSNSEHEFIQRCPAEDINMVT